MTDEPITRDDLSALAPNNAYLQKVLEVELEGLADYMARRMMPEDDSGGVDPMVDKCVGVELRSNELVFSFEFEWGNDLDTGISEEDRQLVDNVSNPVLDYLRGDQKETASKVLAALVNKKLKEQ